MSACDHGTPGAGPNGRERITTRPTVQTWLPGAPVIPGKTWCWNHQRWEDHPVGAARPGNAGEQAEERPLSCTRCGSPVAVVEDIRGFIDWGPAVIDPDGIVRPQYPDPEDGYQTVTYDADHGRARAVCSRPDCGHQWVLRRRFDPVRTEV